MTIYSAVSMDIVVLIITVLDIKILSILINIKQSTERRSHEYEFIYFHMYRSIQAC